MDFSSKIALLALSVIGVGSLAYLLIWKEEDGIVSSISKKNSNETLRIRVPKDCIGAIIGRQGQNIKEIERLTEVKVNFEGDNVDDDFKICIIRGKPEAVEAAETLIHEKISTQPLIETFEMLVPNIAVGRIIGKFGGTIRNISLNSNAKISVSRETVGANQNNIVIRGTSDQIALACSLLKEKVAEELEYQSRIEQSLSNRSPRHQPKYLLATAGQESASGQTVRERLVPTSNDGLLEVYVSALESPDRLWLQVKGPSTVELDRLNDLMTEHYSKPDMREIHRLSEVRLGQLVAAPFMYDKKYYRAEVSEIEKSIDDDPELTLYYLDYGDTGLCRQSHVFALRTDYLKLRFQAIECILARVKPRDDNWTEEAMDLLEELTHVALWKPLTAKIHNYKKRPTRANREGSPVPCVDLYDENEIDIANELVSTGHAVWDLTESVSPSKETAVNGETRSTEEADPKTS